MIWTVRRQSYTPAILGGQVLLAFSTVCMALHSVCALERDEFALNRFGILESALF